MMSDRFAVSACPDRTTLAAFVSGRLGPSAQDSVAAHVTCCAACETTLGSLDDGGDSVVTALRELRAPPAADEQEVPVAALIEQVAAIAAESGASGGLPTRSIGQYELLSKLGSGGMGDVYKARHRRLNKTVALKLLAADRLADAQLLARFEREMNAVGQLSHPHIVQALDAGDADGRHYLAMDYVPGVDLARLVLVCSPLEVADACEIVRQAAAGLQHAHAHGIVHRDIKPGNIMLSDEGVVKILDLGLALPFGSAADGADVTWSGQVIGTVDYMAPEQAVDCHRADARSDIYSLGCTLYKLLTGRAPFPAPRYHTTVQKLLAHAQVPLPPLAAARADAPPRLDEVLARMTAKNPADRYGSAQAVVEAITEFASSSNLPALARRCLAGPSPATVQPRATPSPTATFHPGLNVAAEIQGPRRGRRVRTLVAAGLVLLACGLAGLVVLLKNKSGEVVGKLEAADGTTLEVRSVPDGDVLQPPEAAPDGQAARWALSLGGTVQVRVEGQAEARDVARLDGLPQAAFRLIGVNLGANPRVSDAGLKNLAGLSRLVNLDLHATAIGDAGAVHLRGLTNLRTLSLHHTKISDDALDHLAAMQELTVLLVTGTRITDAGLRRVAGMQRLTALDLGGTRVTDVGLEHLAALPRLNRLGLQFTRVSPAGLASLESLPQLASLDISGLALEDETLAALAKLKSLKEVVVAASRATDADVQRLRAGLPGCEVRRVTGKPPSGAEEGPS